MASIAVAAAKVKAPAQMMAAETWMISQADFRAGTNWAASVYSTVTATPKVSRAGIVTNNPSQRRSRLIDR